MKPIPFSSISAFFRDVLYISASLTATNAVPYTPVAAQKINANKIPLVR